MEQAFSLFGLKVSRSVSLDRIVLESCLYQFCMDSTTESTSILELFFGLKWYKANIHTRDTARSLMLDFGQSLFRGKLISIIFLSYGTLSCVPSPLFIPQTLYLLIIPSFCLWDPFRRRCIVVFLGRVRLSHSTRRILLRVLGSLHHRCKDQ